MCLPRRPLAYTAGKGAVFMCRRTELCGFVLMAAGAALILSVLLPRGTITVLLGAVLIGCGCLVSRRR